MRPPIKDSQPCLMACLLWSGLWLLPKRRLVWLLPNLVRVNQLGLYLDKPVLSSLWLLWHVPLTFTLRWSKLKLPLQMLSPHLNLLERPSNQLTIKAVLQQVPSKSSKTCQLKTSNQSKLRILLKGVARLKTLITTLLYPKDLLTSRVSLTTLQLKELRVKPLVQQKLSRQVLWSFCSSLLVSQLHTTLPSRVTMHPLPS